MADLKLENVLDFLSDAGMNVIVLQDERVERGTLKDYYVSLVRDLCGVYLHFRADSSAAVRCYLEAEYFRNGVWLLPWCSVYENIPIVPHNQGPIIVEALSAGILFLEDFQNG